MTKLEYALLNTIKTLSERLDDREHVWEHAVETIDDIIGNNGDARDIGIKLEEWWETAYYGLTNKGD